MKIILVVCVVLLGALFTSMIDDVLGITDALKNVGNVVRITHIVYTSVWGALVGHVITSSHRWR